MDHMGTDLSIVNAARVSFDKESTFLRSDSDLHQYTSNLVKRKSTDWCMKHDERIQKWIDDIVYPCLNYEDIGLIHYLAKHKHWTPFGQVNIQLRIKMPIFVARQMMRSNVGIVWNEVSRRYVDSEPEFYEPEVWRGRPEGSIKQGSGGEVELGPFTVRWLNQHVEDSLEIYKVMIRDGVAPEQARIVLPQSTYTEVVGNFTLAALARVCALREGKTAQWEIQQYAKAMGEIAKQYFPVSWEALTGGGE